MNELLLATTNSGKFNQLRDALELLDLVLIRLSDVQGAETIVIEENGETVQENARIKATTYAQQLDMTALAMDSGLYLAGLPGEVQPGQYVRRIYGDGEYPLPSDEELLAYYSDLITSLGGKTEGHWDVAVCLATPLGQVFETTWMGKRIFTSRPCQNRVAGYPLESLQIDPQSGMYIADMTDEAKRLFWQKLIGKHICTFVGESLSDER